MATAAHALTPQDLENLQSLLDALPGGLEPLDVVALDGYLCGVLLQPQAVPEARWMPFVLDVEGRTLAAGTEVAALEALVRRRHGELNLAIARRQWFDPWVYELDEAASPSETVAPWVAGFGLAMDRFPRAMQADEAALTEPLALLYRHLDPDELEDADALLDYIDTLEPAETLDEAVEDLVRAVLLTADVTRPLIAAAARRPGRRPAAKPGAGQRRPRSR